MSRCDNCGAECALPFTCQHCGGTYCPDCRLPPNHNCTGIRSWNSKPRPSISLDYGKGGGVSVTGGGYIPDSRRTEKRGSGAGTPYFKIMMGVILLIIIGIAWLVFSGYRMG